MVAANAGGASNQVATPPPISRTLRFLVGAWLLLVVLLNAPAIGGVAAATLAVTVLALAVFYVGLQLLLMRRASLRPALAVVIAVAPVVVIFAVGGTGMALGAVTFYGVSLLVAALRGDPGCEVLSIPGMMLRRRAHVLCLLFSPLDALERRLWRRIRRRR